MGQQDTENTPVLIIGSNNVFEVDCTVEANKIGDNNVFEAKCFVGNKVTVSDGCIIGAGCKLTQQQTLKNNVVVYGEKCFIRDALDQPVVRLVVVRRMLFLVYRFFAASDIANGYFDEDFAQLSSSQAT